MDAETGIFQGVLVKTMMADVVVFCIARLSVAMVLTMHVNHVIVFHKE